MEVAQTDKQKHWIKVFLLQPVFASVPGEDTGW